MALLLKGTGLVLIIRHLQGSMFVIPVLYRMYVRHIKQYIKLCTRVIEDVIK